ncbi:hypothetical protein pEaSNUABM11_00285 [Erwinia phage pEa_SNUABM_11]|nr:hypothetical protein pEaSNUABM11_00285 [Erwinia phage pEa_SNUABM_11]
MALTDRLILPDQGLHVDGGKYDMVNPFSSGQNGPVGQVGKFVTNAHRLRRNVIARVMEFPKWVDYMPNPAIWRQAIKSFIEVHSTISGLDKTLSHEAVQTQQGRNNRIQYEAGMVTEAISSVTHTSPDKHGKVFQNMLWAWLMYGIMDKDTGHPGIVAINNNVPDFLPDMYSMTVLYIEPDAYQRKAQNAFWLTNMIPEAAGQDTGDRDPNTGPQTNELSITFTSQQWTGWGAMQAADLELERMKLYGLRPYSRKLWLTPSQQTDGINPDVNATAGGYRTVSDEFMTNQLSG